MGSAAPRLFSGTESAPSPLCKAALNPSLRVPSRRLSLPLSFSLRGMLLLSLPRGSCVPPGRHSGREEERGGRARSSPCQPDSERAQRPATGVCDCSRTVPHKCFAMLGRGREGGDGSGIGRAPQLAGDGMDRPLLRQLRSTPLGAVTARHPRSAAARD